MADLYDKDELKKKILAIEEDIRTSVAPLCDEKFDMIWYGAYDIDPKYLVYWVCVKSDNMKRALETNAALNAELRSLLEKHQYPVKSQKYVYIGFESQETVDNVSAGNWYHHFK